MEADYILLCDGIVGSKKERIMDGGVAVRGESIVCVGQKDAVAEYLGINTQVYDFRNMFLITYQMKQHENENKDMANIAVFSGKGKRYLQMLMYHGELIFCRN